MQVVHRLPRVRPLVDDETVSGRQTHLLRDPSCGVQQVLVVAVFWNRGDAGNLRARNDHDVDRRDRGDVEKGDAVFVLVDDLGRNLPVDDPGEERGHGRGLPS